MRVAVHPLDRGGCGYYRLIWPAEALAAAGHDVVVEESIDGLHGPGGALLGVLADADVVVFQRPLDRKFAEMIPLLQARGHAVVVEVDDDFHGLPVGHPARRATSVGADPDYNRRWLRIACERADLVTVTTPALADRYASHGRVAVLPNLVPEHYLTVEGRKHERPDLGWTGSVITHVGDLDVMGGVVPAVLEETGARFVAWGTGRTFDALGVKGKLRPWADLVGSYPHQVAALSVGIVPLADNEFNRCKSWLKGLEYAALGVPFVASPLPEYRRLAEVLNGGTGGTLMAGTSSTWAHHLTALLSNPEMRAELGAANREDVRPLTYENNADRWLEAWVTAAETRVKAAA